MIKVYQELLLENNNYSNPKTKIERLVKNKQLIFIKRNLYETNSNIDPFLLTNAIYGPSYISFQTALSYYGLIPEATYKITAATTLKKKSKTFKTSLCTYLYHDIPSNVFPLDLVNLSEENYTCYIASREKAICDMLYILSPVKNQKELKELLFENLRIDEDLFKNLDLNKLIELSSNYHSTNNKILINLIKRFYL